jgi:hypothetical protein
VVGSGQKRAWLAHEDVPRPDVDAVFGPGTSGFRNTYAVDPSVTEWCVATYTDQGDGSPVSGVQPFDCRSQPAA